MDYSDDFIAGWTAAREAAQRKGSVPPYPPGHAVKVEDLVEEPEPPPPPPPPPEDDTTDEN